MAKPVEAEYRRRAQGRKEIAVQSVGHQLLSPRSRSFVELMAVKKYLDTRTVFPSNVTVSIDSVLSRVMTSPSARDHFAARTIAEFCFKLCPKYAYYAQTIISGRSKLVLALLCSSQFYHQSQTRSRHQLGDLYQQTTCTIP